MCVCVGRCFEFSQRQRPWALGWTKEATSKLPQQDGGQGGGRARLLRGGDGAEGDLSNLLLVENPVGDPADDGAPLRLIAFSRQATAMSAAPSLRRGNSAGSRGRRGLRAGEAARLERQKGPVPVVEDEPDDVLLGHVRQLLRKDVLEIDEPGRDVGR